jgi:hypothetical protein
MGDMRDSVRLLPDKWFVHEAKSMLHEIDCVVIRPQESDLPADYWVFLDQAQEGDPRLLNEWAREHYQKHVLPRAAEDRIINVVLRHIGHRFRGVYEDRDIRIATQAAAFEERRRGPDPHWTRARFYLED